jgi:dihydroxynaphthoic acid synthetase
MPRLDSSDYQDILYKVLDGVATITINRPESLNALRSRTVAEMLDGFLRAEDDPEVGVVVLRGAGERAFSVGGDQKELVSQLDAAGWRSFARELRELFRTMRQVGVPIVAAVQGYSIGGGHELHCFADLTVAAESASFGQVGARVGGAPIYVTRLLPRIVGEKKAREIMFLCERYPARDALAMGLVNWVVPDEELDAKVDAVCQDLLDKSPTIIRALKAAIATEDVLGDDVIPLTVESLASFFGSAEQREATTAFAEKRTPDFRQFRRAHE